MHPPDPQSFIYILCVIIINIIISFHLSIHFLILHLLSIPTFSFFYICIFSSIHPLVYLNIINTFSWPSRDSWPSDIICEAVPPFLCPFKCPVDERPHSWLPHCSPPTNHRGASEGMRAPIGIDSNLDNVPTCLITPLQRHWVAKDHLVNVLEAWLERFVGRAGSN